MGTPLLFSEVMDEQGNGAGKGDRLQHGDTAGDPADAEHQRQHGEDSGDEVEKGHGGPFQLFVGWSAAPAREHDILNKTLRESHKDDL